MKTKPLFTFGEPKVDAILARNLASDDLRISPKMRVQDVIGKERTERLESEDFHYMTKAHFDFVVHPQTTPAYPLFAVEFDGPVHAQPEAHRRDAIKNRLCRDANLPLLRIGYSDINEYEKMSVLDFMLQCYVKFQKRHPEIQREIQERLDSLGAEDIETLIDDAPCIDPSLDSGFLFEIETRFPPTLAIQRRLRDNFGVVEGTTGNASKLGGSFSALVLPKGESDPPEENGFVVSSATGYIASAGGLVTESMVLVREERSASARIWLPCADEIPPAPNIADLGKWGPADFDAMNARSAAMWFASVPGISGWHIASEMSEYLVWKALQDWAFENLLTNNGR